MSWGWALFDISIHFYACGIIMLLLVRKLGFVREKFRFIVLGYIMIAATDVFIRLYGLRPGYCVFVLLAETVLYAVFVFKGTFAMRVVWGLISCGLVQTSVNLTMTVYALIGVKDLGSFATPSYIRFIVLVGNLLVITFLYFIIGSIGNKKKGAANPPFWVALISVFAFVLIATRQMASLYMNYGMGTESGISENLVFLASVLVAIFLAVLFFFEYTSLLALKKKQAELALEQKKWEAAFLEQACLTYEVLRAWKHDFKNHMDVLQSFVKNKKYREMEEYLAQMEAEVGPSMQVYHTGNSAADAVLSNKLFMAKTMGIEVSAVAVLPGKLPISDVQFGSVLSNLLDNAIEAQDAAGNSFINVAIRRERGMLQIKVENSANGRYCYKNGLLVSSKEGEGHGIGLASIWKIIEKAGGIMDVQPGADRFCVKILLPLEAESEVS